MSSRRIFSQLAVLGSAVILGAVPLAAKTPTGSPWTERELMVLSAGSFSVSKDIDSIGNRHVRLAGMVPKRCLDGAALDVERRLRAVTLAFTFADSCRTALAHPAELKKILAEPKSDLAGVLREEIVYVPDQELMLRSGDTETALGLFSSSSSSAEEVRLGGIAFDRDVVRANELKKTPAEQVASGDDQSDNKHLYLEAEMARFMENAMSNPDLDNAEMKRTLLREVRRRVATDGRKFGHNLYDKSGKLLKQVISGEVKESQLPPEARVPTNYDLSGQDSGGVVDVETTTKRDEQGRVKEEIGLSASARELLDGVKKQIRGVAPVVDDFTFNYKVRVDAFNGGLVSVRPKHTMEIKPKNGIAEFDTTFSYTRCDPAMAMSFGGGNGGDCDAANTLEVSSGREVKPGLGVGGEIRHENGRGQDGAGGDNTQIMLRTRIRLN